MAALIDQLAASMRPIAFTTIAFLAGQHGFGIFVPYLGCFLVVACALRSFRKPATLAAVAVASMEAVG